MELLDSLCNRCLYLEKDRTIELFPDNRNLSEITTALLGIWSASKGQWFYFCHRELFWSWSLKIAKVSSLTVPWLIFRYSSNSFLKTDWNSFITGSTSPQGKRRMCPPPPLPGGRIPEAVPNPAGHRNGWRSGLYAQEFSLPLHKGCCHWPWSLQGMSGKHEAPVFVRQGQSRLPQWQSLQS